MKSRSTTTPFPTISVTSGINKRTQRPNTQEINKERLDRYKVAVMTTKPKPELLKGITAKVMTAQTSKQHGKGQMPYDTRLTYRLRDDFNSWNIIDTFYQERMFLIESEKDVELKAIVAAHHIEMHEDNTTWLYRRTKRTWN